jgi:hypothetical protein
VSLKAIEQELVTLEVTAIDVQFRANPAFFAKLVL